MASTYGDQIIRTTLNAMLWLGVVEVRSAGDRVEYRLAAKLRAEEGQANHADAQGQEGRS